MMNSAAGSIGRSPLPGAPASPDALLAEAPEEGGFTAALAAVAAEDPAHEQPDIAQSDAALSWVASMLGAGKLLDLHPAAGEGLTSEGDLPEGGAPGGLDLSSRDGATPLALLRAIALQTRDATAMDAPADAAVMAGSLAAGGEAKMDSDVAGSRLIESMLESATLQEGTTDLDAPSSQGPTVYAAAREAVASAAGHISTLPEAVRSAVGSPRWANELASRLVMMAVRGQQEGSLSLTPEHLGPMEVRISVSQDSTSIWFGAQHADTRAALTEALPRLREMLAASGLALGHAGVSDEMPRQEARRGESHGTSLTSGPELTEAAPVSATAMRLRSALLDTWA